MLPCVNYQLVEDEFKKTMRSMGHLVNLQVLKKKQTEVLQGINPNDAEAVLFRIINEFESQSQMDGCVARTGSHSAGTGSYSVGA